MRPFVGKLLTSIFQICILLWVKNFPFFICRVLSYRPFWRKSVSSHFCVNITKTFFLHLGFSTYTNKFLIKCTFKKTFFPAFFIFRSSDIAVSDVFFQKITISNFCYSQLLPLCNLSLERSWGADFKYMYFCVWKTFYFSYIEYHNICTFAGKVYKLTFAWILPKILSWIYIFQSIPTDSLLNVASKNLFSNFFPILVPDILPFQPFSLQKIRICNLRCSEVCLSCDLSLESFRGADFKYIYF